MNQSSIIFGIIGCLLLLGCLLPGSSPPASENWSAMQLKLTYMGIQEKPVPTIGISVKEFILERFQPYQTRSLRYDNDAIALTTFRIRENEMKKAVQAVFALDFVRRPSKPRELYASFMFYNSTSNTATEVLLDADQARIVASTVRDSLKESRSDAGALDFYG